MWPSDTGGNCVPLWRKRKYPCVQSSVTMDNLSVAPLVWAMPDCFLVQYKFLYYDEPCFLKEGTVPSVGDPGQGWEWMDRKEEESPICSLVYHGEATAKHIKASFRSTVWSVCSSVVVFSGRPTGCVDRAGPSSMQKQKGPGNILLLWKMERKRKGWMDRRVAWGGDGGIWGFLSETWKSICARGHRTLWGLTVFSVYLQGMYEYLINESQAQGKWNTRVVVLQSKPISFSL